MWNYLVDPLIIYWNQEQWKAFPPDIQKAIQEAAEESGRFEIALCRCRAGRRQIPQHPEKRLQLHHGSSGPGQIHGIQGHDRFVFAPPTRSRPLPMPRPPCWRNGPRRSERTWWIKPGPTWPIVSTHPLSGQLGPISAQCPKVLSSVCMDAPHRALFAGCDKIFRMS
jgi:hypothetical protein